MILLSRVCCRSAPSHARLLAPGGAVAFAAAFAAGSAAAFAAAFAAGSAASGRTGASQPAVLPNPAALAGDDVSAARHMPNGGGLRNENEFKASEMKLKIILRLPGRDGTTMQSIVSLPQKGVREMLNIKYIGTKH